MRICLLANIVVLSAGVAMAQVPDLPLTRVIGVVGIGSGQTATASQGVSGSHNHPDGGGAAKRPRPGMNARHFSFFLRFLCKNSADYLRIKNES
jgi:hypothetical protein